MNKTMLPALFLSLLITACGITPEKDQAPEVVDKSDSAGMVGDNAGDAETGSGVESYGVDDNRLSVQELLDDSDSLLSVRIIYFDYDSSIVLSQYGEIIQAHAGFLQANPDVITTLEGHADERGSREYNLALGEQRAQAVKQQLVVLGAKPEQIRTVSFGEERPAQPGHDEWAWRQNRRVEIRYPDYAGTGCGPEDRHPPC